jgi:hypothetical protein
MGAPDGGHPAPLTGPAPSRMVRLARPQHDATRWRRWTRRVGHGLAVDPYRASLQMAALPNYRVSRPTAWSGSGTVVWATGRCYDEVTAWPSGPAVLAVNASIASMSS